MTEVNMDAATYVKFDDITNALVELRPTKLAAPGESGEQAAPSPQRNSLETSFNVNLALGDALSKLEPSASSALQTPALGKSRFLPEGSAALFLAGSRQVSPARH